MKKIIIGFMMVCMMFIVGSKDVYASEDIFVLESKLMVSENAVSAPNVSFSYIVDYIESDLLMPSNQVSIDASVFTNYLILDPNSNKEDKYFSTTSNIDFSNLIFSSTGVYCYQITIDTCTYNDEEVEDLYQYGIIKDVNESRYLYVYVVNGEVGYEIDNIIMTSELDDVSKSDGYVHSFGVVASDGDGSGEDPYVPGEAGGKSLRDVAVSNGITGNMANLAKDFSFILSNGTNISENTVFKVFDGTTNHYISYSNEHGFIEGTLVYNEELKGYQFNAYIDDIDYREASYLLTNNESFTIYSTVSDMSFEVISIYEENYITSSSPIGELLDGNYLAKSNEAIDFTQTYELTVPETGVFLNILPYVLGIVVTSLIGIGYLRIKDDC